MAVGGFNGTDPAPTLAQFQALVAAGKIHYFVGGGTAMGGRGASTDTGGSDDATRIARWVQENFAATTVGGTTVYDLDRGRLVTDVAAFRSDHAEPAAGRTVDAQVRHNDRTAPPTTLDDMSIDVAEPDLHPAQPPAATGRVVLDVVVPVYNEETDLEPSVRRLDAHLAAQFPYSYRITIADNASTDATPSIARALAGEIPAVGVRAAGGEGPRPGAAHGVVASDAAVLAYCDVDLSTDLAALLPLVAPLISGHSDLAIGTRLAPRLAGRPRPEAGVHLPLLQPAAARHAADRLHRRPVRLQGHPRRRRPAAAAARARTPAGSSTPRCWCSPSARACGSTRCPSTGSTTPTPASTSSRRRWPTCAASARVGRALGSAGAAAVAELRAQLGRAPLAPSVARVPTAMPRQLVRFAAIGVGEHCRATCCCSSCSAA